MKFKNLREQSKAKTGIMSLSTPSQVPDKYALDPGDEIVTRVRSLTDKDMPPKKEIETKFPSYEDLLKKQLKKETQ